MNLPNKLTISRILLALPFGILLYLPGLYAKIAALVLFLVMVATDILDGIIAVESGLTTVSGKFLDPVADKIMVSVALIVFVEFGLIPAWIAIIILAREFLVTGLRSIASSRGKVIGANIFGKSKFGLQTFAIFLVLLLMVLRETSTLAAASDLMLQQAVLLAMGLAALATVISAIYIIWANRKTIGSL